MIYMIMGVCFIFYLFNYKITGKDFLHPSVIFSLIFLLQSIMCIIVGSYLKLTFHIETLLIILTSLIIFSVFTILQNVILKKQFPIDILALKSGSKLSYLALPKLLLLINIFCFLIVILMKYEYLTKLSNVLGYGNISLSEKISLYDYLVKFNLSKFQSIRIFLPRFHNLLNIFAIASGYLVTYISINNFVVSRKISFLSIFTLLLMIVNMYLGGSRSTIFRLFTFIGFLYYTLTLRNGVTFKLVKKLNRNLIMGAVCFIVLFFLTMGVFGRSTSTNLFHYFFIYSGAPLYNLDVFIQNYNLPVQQTYFGQQTLIGIYNFILPKIGISKYPLDLPFVRYSQEYGLGNVYTTFYQFIYDFGIIGFIPFISMIAFYYIHSYTVIKNRTVIPNVDFRLLVFAFLFNDLIMLFFSNRFFETILDFSNLSIFLVAFILSTIMFNKSISFKNIKINLY